ncbi:hypothetical protein CC85DRAFT_286283 [Cutaneotrichosporon oleaginosum]|uniref:Uncharacterized protein n=1 Tax=Cutaneotrichosporon oleaginosum TaxID=879819 RepID=A0A0J1B1Y3_9TREE|nr:uncharacterized protein CC85DRAFT_286283 [Cutaneotrichosporon oleaginosum]KLT41629.1 hypothetical protein CC85DRAFT_286283 [Cutaneotrichosporon oleaginosum]TXT08134.1 hypothetical protein COLE_05058 [Cutaneotrichosporon oleaginosum]
MRANSRRQRISANCGWPMYAVSCGMRARVMPTNHKTRRKTKALVPNASSRPRSIPRFRGSSATAPVRTDPRHPRSTHSQPHPVPGPPDAKRRSERTGEVIAAVSGEHAGEHMRQAVASMQKVEIRGVSSCIKDVDGRMRTILLSEAVIET